MHPAGWKWRSALFAVTVYAVDALLLRRILIDTVPWPEVVPPAAHAVLFLFLLILCGAAAHAGWWTLEYLWRRGTRRARSR